MPAPKGLGPRCVRKVATGSVTQKREPWPCSLSTPDLTAHEIDQALDDREPESGAAVVARGGGVDLREGLEQPVEPVGRNPDAGVRHLDAQGWRRLAVRALETCRSTWPSWVNFTALPIRFMVIWRMRPGSPRASTGTSGSMLTTSSMPLTAACERGRGGRVVDDVAQIVVDVLELEPAGLDLGEVEHVVDQREERLRAAADDVDVLALRVVEIGLGENLRHADHAVHGRADLVGDVREKIALGSIGRFRGELGIERRLGRLWRSVSSSALARAKYR